MVLVKRTLDNGLNGYNSAAIPRAPRSARRRGSRQRTHDGGQICAFELLATVAGKLLEESECSSASSSAALGFNLHGNSDDVIKKELQDVDKSLGREHDEQGSSEGSVSFSGLQRDVCKGKLETVSEPNGEHASPFSSFACSDKAYSNSKFTILESDGEFVKPANKIGGSPRCGDSDKTNLENGINRQLDANEGTTRDFTTTRSPATVNSEEKVMSPPGRGSNPNASFFKNENGVRVGCKDDDEILSHYSQPNSTMKAYKSSTHFGDRKLKQLLTSKCWKTAPKLKDYEPSNRGSAVKHVYHNKRSHYDLDKSQRNAPFKKRKLFDRSSVVTYDGGISCESVSNSPEKSTDGEKNASAGKLTEEKGMSSSEVAHQKSCNLRNSHVRLSIKSFKVPDLFIEVPESTTVGSLKRTVLEAVTTILGGGLRLGVLLHGKKIQDDNITLLQTGVSQNDDMDTIGFMLEPNSPTQPSHPLYCEDQPVPLSCDSPKFVNSGDLVPSPTTELSDNNMSNSKALVPVPEASAEALAVVPVNQRTKRSEIGQRRTRRPFSVSEVEALVQAVEKLGTGRWRDVKLCAFDNAKHRTYVDLKDKWKTLVHTARISPQQRRGEPVPQELLDRVLAAQAYWSEHQAKQHGKQTIIPKLTDSPAVKA
uniref:HTH myb-type domain-containing protein n=1 Tax=Opuntia streptacantha TaxID=393608 RepID=A0A7C9ENB3_OPUST